MSFANRQTAGRLGGCECDSAGVEDIVAFGAGAATVGGEPVIEVGEAVVEKQPTSQREPLLRMFRRQRRAGIQPQEDELRMGFAEIEVSVRSRKGVDLHDLRAKMPELQ